MMSTPAPSQLPSTMRQATGRGDDSPRLCLLVIGDDRFSTRSVPDRGVLSIGRDADCDVSVDDPSVSRRHAMLYLGPTPSIEDLSSANGVRVRGAQIPAGERVSLAIGEVIDIGGLMMILQQRAAPLRPRRAWAPGHVAASNDAGEAPMQSLHRLVERIARSQISVLIGGETGVGKEVLAETIHRLSPRRDGQFLRLNCAALSETLLESELFGHERGAFTGATHAKIGLLETAQGGTVFLDEVGELPLSTQVKLLRVLEERHVLPVGALKARAIDVRFIAATNRDLEAEVARRTFRQDLYFRLNAVSLVIPPLRDRVGEIDGLVRTFVARASREANRERAHVLSASAMELLKAYAWPGNIRELRNVIERAVVLAEDDDLITPDHLPVDKLVVGPPGRAPDDDDDDDSDDDITPAAPVDVPGSSVERLRQAVEDEERARVIEALNACAGNQTRAAERLGIARRTLVKRLRKLGVPRPRKG